MSPALTGGFFTSEPSGKPLELLKLVVMGKVFFFFSKYWAGRQSAEFSSCFKISFFFLSYLNLSYTWNLF